MRTDPRLVTAGAALCALGVVAVAGCSSSPQATSPAPSSSAPQSARPSHPSKHSAPPTKPSAPHATEFNPPGDIPDNAVFVDHTAPGSHVHFRVPEGWGRARAGAVTTYTDKYNSVSIEVRRRPSAPTPASARRQDVPELRRTVPSFHLRGIETVARQQGRAVRILYLRDSKPNPVTGKVVRDAVERYEFWHAGQEAILSLTGPQHADNVDPWRIVSNSLRWR